MGSNVPMMNESNNEMIYEMNHILNCGYARIIASLDFISAVQ